MITPLRNFDFPRAGLFLAVLLYAAGMFTHPLVHAAEYGKAVVEAEQEGTTLPPLEADGEVCEFLCQSVPSVASFAGALSLPELVQDGLAGLTASSPLWASLAHHPTLPRDPPLA